MNNRWLKIIIRLCISLFFIIYLAMTIDVSGVISAFKKIDALYYIYSLLFAFGSVFFIASKYFFLIRNTLISLSIASLMKINLISQYYAIFLPSTLATEAVRWYKVTKNEQGRTFFLLTTIYERLTFVFIILLF